MPAPIVIRNLTPETKKAANPGPDEPLIATKAGLRDGSRGVVDQTPAGVIFQDNFDSQPDWTSTLYSTSKKQDRANGDILPEGWDSIYQGTAWSPEMGDTNKHASLEILASNTDKARGGTGKSAVMWRESYNVGWYTTPRTLNAGTWVRMQHMTAKTYDTEVVQSLIVGGTTYTFTSRTAVNEGSVSPANPGTVLNSTFVDATGQPLYTRVVSNPIEITADGTVVDPGANGEFSYSTNQGQNYTNWQYWASDSQTVKLLDVPTKELYVEFYISFSPDWYQRTNYGNWASKMFRIAYWNGQGSVFNGALGDLGPTVFWDYKRDQYGVINRVSYRGGQGGNTYYFNGAHVTDTFVNYGSATAGMAVGGGDPQVLDQVNGGFLVNKTGIITHDQAFGPADHWTKMGFYVKSNSAVGVADGVFSQYMNDQRIKHKTDVPWVVDNGPIIGWNFFAIGGNDYFHPYPNREKYEDWYAIDDVMASNSLPEGLK